ncbi:MAG: glycogen/starch synthase [Tannerella sp.]|jgi:starch synthase|nr:glycogen/starch synthase [Tannerella sp.]
MDAKRVLFITQEINPYLSESEIATICRDLPQGIQELGREIRTFMPKYGCINERRNQLHEVIRLSGMNLIIDDTDHPLIIKVASIQSARMQVYFIDNDDFFCQKATVFDEREEGFEDNDERAIFYVRGVFETIKKLRWIPDVIHCHGWLTALAPLYMKRLYADDPCFARTKIVYSVYDNAFHSTLGKDLKKKLKLDGATDHDMKLVDSPDFFSITRLAVHFSDAVIQGSPEIDPQIVAQIAKSKKRFLPYQEPENYISAYNDFYDLLIDPKQKKQ